LKASNNKYVLEEKTGVDSPGIIMGNNSDAPAAVVDREKTKKDG
jgi:hypothetical protein